MRWILIVVALALAAGASACGSASSAGQGGTGQSAPNLSTLPAVCTSLNTWNTIAVTGGPAPGQLRVNAVFADLATVNKDAGNPIQQSADGAALNAQANEAWYFPPPIAAADYQQAMGDFAAEGKTYWDAPPPDNYGSAAAPGEDAAGQAAWKRVTATLNSTCPGMSI
jgi:hypothetical protein